MKKTYISAFIIIFLSFFAKAQERYQVQRDQVIFELFGHPS